MGMAASPAGKGFFLAPPRRPASLGKQDRLSCRPTQEGAGVALLPQAGLRLPIPRGFLPTSLGYNAPVSAVALVLIGTVVLAVLLAVLLPGAGFIGSIVVAVIGLAAVVWLVSAGAARQAPSDVTRSTENHEFLGPGGPDDPGRP